jgi:hypothetical protein
MCVTRYRAAPAGGFAAPAQITRRVRGRSSSGIQDLGQPACGQVAPGRGARRSAESVTPGALEAAEACV